MAMNLFDPRAAAYTNTTRLKCILIPTQCQSVRKYKDRLGIHVNTKTVFKFTDRLAHLCQRVRLLYRSISAAAAAYRR